MNAKNWLQLIILSVLWGGTFIFVKEALPSLPPLSLTLARCAIAALVLAPAVLALGYQMPPRSQWRDFAVMALLNNVIPFGVIFWGQTMIPSGLAAVANATTPLMALLVARVLAGEALSRNKFIGVLLGMAGVAVLVGPAALAGEKSSAFGVGLVMIGTLSYGLSGLWGRRFKASPPIVSSLLQLTAATLILIPIAGVADRFWTLPIPPTNVIIAVLALGIVSTALAYILFFRIMAEAGSNNVMLVTLLIPISAITAGGLHFGERLSVNQFAGAAIIALSLLVIDGRVFGLHRAPAVARTEK